MNSTLTLINGTKITPERNFKVPNMEFVKNSGLNGYRVISDFMYIKHSLNLTIKVDISQENLEYIFANDVNYIIIKNNFEGSSLPKEVGYFVTNKRWMAKETIEYTLLCDVVNSFNDSVEISDKTRILRQHKDRWKREAVSATAHIGDVKSYPNWLSEMSDELTIYHKIQGKEIRVAILDLWNSGSVYLNGVVFGMKGALFANYYFLDENYNVISEIPITWEDGAYGDPENDVNTKVGIIIEQGSGTDVHVKDLVQRTPSDWIHQPQNARYIALSYETVSFEPSQYLQCFYYLQVENWEDVPEEDWDTYWNELVSHSQIIEKIGIYYEETVGSKKIIPIIDRYSENISPMLYGGAKYFLQEKGQLAPTDWYLIYKNQNDPSDSLLNPVNCFICASQQTSFVQASGTSGTYNQTAIWKILAKINGYAEDEYLLFAHDVETGKIPYGSVRGLVFCGQFDNIDCQFTISSPDVSGTHDLHSTSRSVANNLYIIPMRRTQPNGIELWMFLIPNSDDILVENMIFNTSVGITDSFSFSFTNGKVARIITDTLGTNQAFMITTYQPQAPFFMGAGSVLSVYGINQVDRTDPKLIKIIKLPYCPANVVIGEDGYLRFSDEYNYDVNEHMLKVNRLSTTFNRILNIDMPLTAWSNAFAEYDYSLIVKTDREKSYEMETKLFHSDYYLPKIIYDSYTFVFQLELMTNRPNDNWQIQFNASNTINSRFMFTFLDYVCENNETRDYNNIMYVARNNDCVIFNQQYINYIRTGYNYDKKSLELLKEKIDTGFNFDIAKGATSTFFGGVGEIMKQNYMGMYSRLANFGISIGETAVMNNYAKIEAEMQLEAKKVQLQNQSTGVMDANDVDLLNVYSRNKLALKFYEVSPRMKKALFNLFYYCGYICEEQGIPDTTSRLRFNFVQAEIVFVKTPNLPQEMIAQLKDLYKLGITFLHAYNGQIDYEQKYENWEVSILDN